MSSTIETTAPEEGFGLTTGSTDQYGVVRDRLLLWQTTQGFVAPDAVSSQDLLAKAGLDWDVEMLPLEVKDPDGNVITDPKRRVIVGTDTYAPLGVAKSRYVPLPNREVLEFADQLFDSGSALFEAAWEWRGGEAVGITMRLPDAVNIGGFDKHDLYMLFKTSHDGGGSLVGAATPVRLACTNMVTIALRKAARTFRFPHTSSLQGKLAEARKALDLTYEYAQAWEAEVEALINETITEEKVLKVATELFGEKKAPAAVEHWVSVPNIADFRETHYGAYNAMTEFAQWERPRDPQLESAIFGPIAKQTDKAFKLLQVA